MNLIVCFLVVVHFSGCARAGGGGKGSKHDLFKIHVPEIVKHQHHTHYVYIHEHAPTKSHKKPAIKHSGHSHHHKHSFGIHTLHGHKHMARHGPPVVKHVTVVHKIPHHHTVSHKPHKPQTVHKPHILPTHKHKTIPKTHKPKEQHQQSYPFTHEDVRYSASPDYPGYQVTEDYDPENEVLNGFHPDDYTVPGELSDPAIEGEQHTLGGNPSQADEPSKPYPGFFTYPTSHSAGTYRNYGSPGLSSYDISPYHQMESPEKNQRDPNIFYGVGNTNTADEGSPYASSILPQQEEDYQGDHEFNYDHQSDSGSPFQHGGYDDFSHEGHESNEFGENIPSFTQNHKKVLNNVNHGIQTTAYDDRVHKYIADDTGDRQAQTVGFQHNFSHGGHYVSHV